MPKKKSFATRNLKDCLPSLPDLWSSVMNFFSPGLERFSFKTVVVFFSLFCFFENSFLD
jgi:hypothetical protein